MLSRVTLSYFCYISRQKIDSLYEQLNPKAYYEFSESQTKTVDVGLNASANWGIGHIVSLFRVGGTYGRTGVLQRDSKIKQGYIEKLRAVLAALTEQSAIQPLTASTDTHAEQTIFYHYTGAFRIESPLAEYKLSRDSVVTIVSKLEQKNLMLDVSLRYFSEGPSADGTFRLNSGNMRFFKGDVSLTMTCVLLLLDATADRTIGSPLFLKLSYSDDRPFLAL